MSITVDVDDTLAGLPEAGAGACAPNSGECAGEMCPEPWRLPASISKALKARVVEREREQPRKT